MASYVPVMGGFSFSVSAIEASYPNDLDPPSTSSVDCRVLDFDSIALPLYSFTSIVSELEKPVDAPAIYYSIAK